MGSGVSGWAIERDADVDGQAFWRQYYTELYAADLADYVTEFNHRLPALTSEERPTGSDEPPVPGSQVIAVRTAASGGTDAGVPAAGDLDTPFRGLRSYGRTEARLFFGRDRERDGIASNLRVARLTLLYATSGAGVSSLLRAGVVASLVERARGRVVDGDPPQYVPVLFGSWRDDPVSGLIAAIEQQTSEFAAPGAVVALPRESLEDAIDRASQALDATLLLLLDQFEDYVLYRERERSLVLADQLARCVNRRDMRANILIAIRDDAYAALGDLFAGRITNVYGNYLRIEPLGRDEAREAIVQPVREWNSRHPDHPVQVEPELIEVILDEARTPDRDGGGRISTTLMQLIMSAVWQQAMVDGSLVLRRESLYSMDGAAGILKTSVADALATLTPDELEIATDVLAEFVRASAEKVAMPAADLAAYTQHPRVALDTVLAKLDQGRLVRVVAPAPGADPVRDRRYEIFHEVLVAPIRSWLASQQRQRVQTKEPRRRGHRWPRSR